MAATMTMTISVVVIDDRFMTRLQVRQKKLDNSSCFFRGAA
jgi:hypothetical protein